MAASVNSVVLVGNLTRDPELRGAADGGTTICGLRLAVNGRRKAGDSWVDEPNFFDVTVFGGQAQACADHLAKGRQVAISGRLDWREWDASDGSGKRQAVQVIAEQVQFLGSPKSAQEAGEQPASA